MGIGSQVLIPSFFISVWLSKLLTVLSANKRKVCKSYRVSSVNVTFLSFSSGNYLKESKLDIFINIKMLKNEY